MAAVFLPAPPPPLQQEDVWQQALPHSLTRNHVRIILQVKTNSTSKSAVAATSIYGEDAWSHWLAPTGPVCRR